MDGNSIQLNSWKLYFTLSIMFFCFQYTGASVFIAYTLSDHKFKPNLSIPWPVLFWKLSFSLHFCCFSKMIHHQHNTFCTGEPTASIIWHSQVVVAFQWAEFKTTVPYGETKLNLFLPFSSTASTLAPFPNSSWTTTVSPFRAATCRGLRREANSYIKLRTR